MRLSPRCGIAVLSMAVFFTAPSFATEIPKPIAAAVADPARGPADQARDADRKPAESLVFAGVKPGEKILEFAPGGGYFTRLFAGAVGAKGHVYAWKPSDPKPPPGGSKPPAPNPGKPIADYANVTVLKGPSATLSAPEPVDLVWTSQNYHDLHNKSWGPVDIGAFNKAVYKALKPGGTYIVLDHAAAPDSGLESTETLHRINPDIAKKEVLAAGFVLVSESDILRNPADDHHARVFDSAIRGKTDQFFFKFRKPR